MQNSIKVGFITESDPTDKKSWSGIYFRMINELKSQGFEIEVLGPVRLNKKVFRLRQVLLSLIEKIHWKLTGKKYNKIHCYINSFFDGLYFSKKINKSNINVVFAPASSTQIAHLKTKKPIYYFSDSTLPLMFDYYEAFSGLSDISKKESKSIEKRAIRKSSVNLFSSNWAQNSAVKDYGAKNTFVVKMGANIDTPTADHINVKEFEGTINFLFVGVDWKRKGGEIVISTFQKLLQNGFNVHLTIVGCDPKIQKNPCIEVIPFLDKNNEDEIQKLENLYKRSHLFFLPTRAECFGIVFCEANSYGIPVISTDTGGVSSVIQNDINGYLLALSATHKDYYEEIVKLLINRNKLKEISISSREKYLRDLNWGVWGIQMKEIITATYNKNVLQY